MGKRKPKAALSELENKVMKIVWKLREAKAEEIRLNLAKAHPLTDSTIRTVLRRLAAKGYVKHRVEGRTYIYSPIEKSQAVAVDAVRSIIDRFCNGSVESLLVGMIDRNVVSAAKLQELAERIEQSQSETNTGDKTQY